MVIRLKQRFNRSMCGVFGRNLTGWTILLLNSTETFTDQVSVTTRCLWTGDRASLSPDGVVGCAEVDEEVPGPVGHFEKVFHAAQVHGQQAGPAPDGRHSPGGDPDVGVLAGQRQDLSVEEVGPLGRKDKTQGGQFESAQEDEAPGVTGGLTWSTWT